MSSRTALQLCQSRFGRCVVHAVMFKRDHRFVYHVQGIWREVTRQGNARVQAPHMPHAA